VLKLEQLKNKRITLDGSIINYALVKDEKFRPFALEILQAIEKGEIERGFLSSISFAEIIGSFKEEEVARKMEVLLSHFPNLTIVPIHLEEAAQEMAYVQQKMILRLTGLSRWQRPSSLNELC
jgi:hypothetical protein